MLPTLDLDDERYEEIEKRAKKLIATLYPDWTDYNEHDPGITLIELFAWLQEMQQYHLNQTGSDSYEKYRKLLGLHRKLCCPAKTYLQVVSSKESYHLRKGCLSYAEDIPFETISEEFILGARITKLESAVRKQGQVGHQEMELKQGWFQYFPFGNDPKAGDTFTITLDQPLVQNEIINFYVQIYENYPVHRNQIDGSDFYPLADISYEYYDGECYRPMEVVEDGTWQLIHSGLIRLRLQDDSTNYSKVSQIRLTLLRAEYDVAPIIEKLFIDMVEVHQQQTLVERYDTRVKKQAGHFTIEDPLGEVLESERDIFAQTSNGTYRPIQVITVIHLEKSDTLVLSNDGLYEGMKVLIIHNRWENSLITSMTETNGFPNQEYELFPKMMITEKFQLLIEDEIAQGSYHMWKRVEDFGGSVPEDRHYVLDEGNGMIRFGDCFHGRAPEGRVRIVSCAITKGIQGNVMAGQMKQLDCKDRSLEVMNYQEASGGFSGETIEDCIKRWLYQRGHQKRAVTYEDYEAAVKQVPGLMIQKVKAVPVSKMQRSDGSVSDHCTYLVVEPYGAKVGKKLSNAYQINIQRMLDRIRMIGTTYQIMPTQYIPIMIFAEVLVSANYAKPKEIIEQALRNYFMQHQSQFGETILYSNIYGTMDTLDCVRQITSLAIEVQGRGASKNSNGDILVVPNGIALIQSVNLTVTVG